MQSIETLERRNLLSAYYVSAAGSDANDGLCEAEPFATISQALSKDLNAGDQVLLRAGDTFREAVQITGDDAGTAAAPLIFGRYGTAAADPIIEVGNSHGIQVLNVGGVELRNLKVVGVGQPTPGATDRGDFNGVDVRNTLPGDSKLDYIRVINVETSGFNNYGVEIIGTQGKSGFRDVVIQGVESYGNKNGGIASNGAWDNTTTTYAHHDVFVLNCEVYDNTGWAGSTNHTGDGIVMSEVQGLTIERNVAYRNGKDNTHVGGPVGIWAWHVDQAEIRYNESHHNLTASTADGGGFDFDGGVTNSVMEYNYSHHNAGAGYGIYQFGGARPFYNNHIRYNISVDDGRKNSYGAIDFWNGNGTNGIRDTHVYNNTVIVSPSLDPLKKDRKGNALKLGDPRALRFISGTVDVTLRNNNFYISGGVLLAQIDARQTNLKMDGNNWFASGAFALKVFAKTYTTFGAYVSGTGHDKQGRNLDPMFASTTAKDITIERIDELETLLDEFRVGSGSDLAKGANAGFDLASVYTYSLSKGSAPYITAPTTDFDGVGDANGSDDRYTIGAFDFV